MPHFSVLSAMRVLVGSLATTTLLAVTAPSESSVSYEAWTVGGQDFRVGRVSGLEVWFYPVDGSSEFGANIFVVNGSDQPIEVFPERIRAVAVSISEKGEKRTTLRTYHPVQYENLLRRRFRRQGALLPRTGSAMDSSGSGITQGPHAGLPSVRSGGAAPNGPSKPGPWLPTPRDIPEPDSEKGQAFSDSLLRPHKIPNHQSYGGMVYISRQSGDSYHISIPIGATSFDFDFKLPQRGNSKPE